MIVQEMQLVVVRAFRDYQANLLSCYNIDVYYVLHVKLVGAILVIEIVFYKGWHHLGLEIDSHLVIKVNLVLFTNNFTWWNIACLALFGIISITIS
jgi:hypothetical protein